MADALRGSSDVDESKHVFRSLLFLGYICDRGGERLWGDSRWQYGAPPADSPPLSSFQADCRGVA